jgi:gamma-glutamylcyclotransferase (GGCT)/AIG2-like uncharacterized protein YtfP
MVSAVAIATPGGQAVNVEAIAPQSVLSVSPRAALPTLPIHRHHAADLGPADGLQLDLMPTSALWVAEAAIMAGANQSPNRPEIDPPTDSDPELGVLRIQSQPAPSAPFQLEPFQSAPFQPEPFQSTPLQLQPTLLNPASYQLAPSQPTSAQPTSSEPTSSESASPQAPSESAPAPTPGPNILPPPAMQPPPQSGSAQTDCDRELGCLRLKPAPPPAIPVAKAPIAYFLGQVDYYRSSNIFAGIDPVNDGFVRPSATLLFVPPLGPDTFLVASVDGSLFRYNNQTVNNLDELRLNAALLQRVSPTMFVGLGWTNQKYYYASNIPLVVENGSVTQQIPEGTQFFNENSVRLEISRRDRLASKLSLNTFYQLRLVFADPFSTKPFYSEGFRDKGITEDRSRVLNTFVASLNYDIQPNLQAGLDYQFSMANFTRQNRDDAYHQISARLNYTAFRNTQFKVYGGFSFGNSTRSDISFDGAIIGVSISMNLTLF